MSDGRNSHPCARCGGSRGHEPRASTLLCPDCRYVMSPEEQAAFLGKTPPVWLDVADWADSDEGMEAA